MEPEDSNEMGDFKPGKHIGLTSDKNFPVFLPVRLTSVWAPGNDVQNRHKEKEQKTERKTADKNRHVKSQVYNPIPYCKPFVSVKLQKSPSSDTVTTVSPEKRRKMADFKEILFPPRNFKGAIPYRKPSFEAINTKNSESNIKTETPFVKSKAKLPVFDKLSQKSSQPTAPTWPNVNKILATFGNEKCSPHSAPRFPVPFKKRTDKTWQQPARFVSEKMKGFDGKAKEIVTKSQSTTDNFNAKKKAVSRIGRYYKYLVNVVENIDKPEQDDEKKCGDKSTNNDIKAKEMDKDNLSITEEQTKCTSKARDNPSLSNTEGRTKHSSNARDNPNLSNMKEQTKYSSKARDNPNLSNMKEQTKYSSKARDNPNLSNTEGRTKHSSNARDNPNLSNTEKRTKYSSNARDNPYLSKKEERTKSSSNARDNPYLLNTEERTKYSSNARDNPYLSNTEELTKYSSNARDNPYLLKKEERTKFSSNARGNPYLSNTEERTDFTSNAQDNPNLNLSNTEELTNLTSSPQDNPNPNLSNTAERTNFTWNSKDNPNPNLSNTTERTNFTSNAQDINECTSYTEYETYNIEKSLKISECNQCSNEENVIEVNELDIPPLVNERKIGPYSIITVSSSILQWLLEFLRRYLFFTFIFIRIFH